MKRKRDWIALVEYMDENQKIKQVMQSAFNPKTLSGLAKLVIGYVNAETCTHIGGNIPKGAQVK